MSLNITKLLFLDIETVSGYESVYSLPEKQKKMFDKYFENFNEKVIGETRKKFPWKKTLSIDELDEYKNRYEDDVYKNTAALFPEFGKIVCVSVGFISDIGEIKLQSFTGEEKDILMETRTLLDKVHKLGYSLCGHNIKIFDIPFLGKKYYIHGLKLPKIFPTHDSKPWELSIVDTRDVWQFNARGIGSLDLITSVLGVESPKSGDVQGDSVSSSYWDGKIDEIKEYCERDVKALIDIMIKINDLK